MKRILAIMAVFVLAFVGIASATVTPNFAISKDVIVTGDWVYNGGWTLPAEKPITATYQMEAVSQDALNVFYGETEVLGQPWKYQLMSELSIDAPSTISNQLNVVTVNDPKISPEIDQDGFTTYNFENHNYGKFTASHLVVNGQGWATIFTGLTAQSEITQLVGVGIN
ncbi:MAG: hypothetical protein PHT54_02180 [Candidatus Nanoarchaeia archaeon]|nr:hypothetical protein [Candidatus Nanoarchaeia archaeon]